MWQEAWSKSTEDHFRCVLWSPDGLCMLSQDSCDRLLLMELQEDFTAHGPVLQYREPACIYSIDWYPLMSSNDPTTCFFAVTARSQPIHLWDAFNGQLRCSFRCYDQYDEIESPLTVKFDPSGDIIVAGSRRGQLRRFDVNRCGRDCDQITVGSKNCLISSIAFSPSNPKLFAVGSYSGEIQLFDMDTCWDHEKPVLIVDYAENCKKGVSQVMIHPNGNDMIVSGRCSDDIHRWDLRKMDQVVTTYKRICTNNQRIYFDITAFGDVLVTASQDGLVRLYNYEDGGELQTIKASDDVVCGVQFHPSQPLLACCSGARHFDDESIENKLSIWSFS